MSGAAAHTSDHTGLTGKRQPNLPLLLHRRPARNLDAASDVELLPGLETAQAAAGARRYTADASGCAGRSAAVLSSIVRGTLVRGVWPDWTAADLRRPMRGDFLTAARRSGCLLQGKGEIARAVGVSPVTGH